MLCPVMMAGRQTTEYCQKEQCAWWDHIEHQCCILTLAYETANQLGYFRELFQLKEKQNEPES